MTTHPGNWPVSQPLDLNNLDAVEVRLTMVVDLTGRYNDAREVAEDFQMQTKRNQDCHTAIVRLGADATQLCTGLGRDIARAFYLSARRIELEMPAGRWQAPTLYGEVAYYTRLYRADHQRMTTELTRTSG
ncbi:hypothetical protein ACFV0H_07510 [Streptomyces erythrochromogenes]|uniref:hypothetical protein n=1 Tax=Streptomyces erythrochromogenes TaxID=285574 RepID=UPI003694FE6A